MTTPMSGSNSKEFFLHQPESIISVVAVVNDLSQQLHIKVSGNKIRAVQNCLNELVLSTGSYAANQTNLLTVWDINKIKEALLRLKNECFISESSYLDISRNFPKPGNGTVNLLIQDYSLESSTLAVKFDAHDDLKDFGKSLEGSQLRGFFNRSTENKKAHVDLIAPIAIRKSQR